MIRGPDRRREKRALKRLCRALPGLLSAQLLLPSAARAENELGSVDVAYEKAQALFQEGRRLMSDGRTFEACERFEQSLTFEDAVGTKFNLAACWESLGKTASAQALFAEVAEKTERLGQTERSEVALGRAAALESRLSRLLIDADAPENLSIQRNETLVESKDLGAALAVDPGEYEVRATAPGKHPWSRHVRVGGQRALVVVTVPRLLDVETAPEEARQEPAEGTEQARAEASPRLAQSEDALSWRRPVAFGLATLGLGGLAAGSVFALKYRASNDKAEGICTARPSCSREEIVLHAHLAREARAARNGAYVSLGVGLAAFAGAAIAYFGPVYRTEGGMELRAAPAIDTSSFGLAARGQF